LICSGFYVGFVHGWVLIGVFIGFVLSPVEGLRFRNSWFRVAGLDMHGSGFRVERSGFKV
jgi:hypothetical protein